jgi:shikimate dehydrogenase
VSAIDQYVVIGNPIAQSKSPIIHASFARDCAQNLEYNRLEAPLGGFAASVDAFRARGGRGANVTAPFKLDAFAYATDLSERARLAGAVNALKFVGDQVFAENFDGVGLVNDIQANLGVQLRGLRILLLGAGGAARGAVLPLMQTAPAQLVVANRTVSRARELATQFSPYGAIFGCGYEDLNGHSFDVVLNATSASLTQSLPAAPNSIYHLGTLAYELVYGKGLTPFLQQAQSAGVTRLSDGVGMLVEQAAEAFVWWRGVRPPSTRPLIAQLTVPLVHVESKPKQ